MITRDTAAFVAYAKTCASDFGPATAKAVFLVSPDGFARAEQSAFDNRYMAGLGAFDVRKAQQQHDGLQQALRRQLPVVCCAGDPATPDAVFPNNVFATANNRFIVGRMRHPIRQPEAQRADIRDFFTKTMRYSECDLSAQPHVCELTGALVIDRLRGIGFCGLSERCDEIGAGLMHDAFALRATLLFDLAPGEYHTNVVLAILAGRSVLMSPSGFADSAVAAAIQALYAPHVLLLSAQAQASFACNVIALSPHLVWMSTQAAAALTADQRSALESAGWKTRSVPLDAIEAAGGSLRCCVAEIF